MTTATRACLAAIASSSLLLAVPAARAEPKVLVLEFAGEPADAAASLTGAMAEAIRAAGPEVSQASREDALTLAGCAEPTDDCLRQALGVLEAETAVTGEVRATAAGLAVDLRAVGADGAPRTRTVELAAGGDLAARFRPEAAAFWSDEPSPAAAAAAAPEPAAAPVTAEVGAGAEPPADGFSAGRVEPYAWAIAGTGAGLLAVGSVLLVAASGKQGEVDDAPTDTVDDLDHLVELEESGRRYARWGNLCLVVGGIAAIAGGVLIVRQGRQPAGEDEAATRLTLAPTADGLGAGFVVRGGF